MFTRLPLILIAILTSFCSLAQQKGYKKQGNEFTFSATNSVLKIGFCSSSMFRVRTSWNKQFEANESWMVVKYDWAPVNIKVTAQKDHYLLQSADLSIKVYQPSLRIEVLDKKGNIISSEQTSKGGSAKTGDTVRCTKKLYPSEHFFGFGERMDFLDRRNKNLKLNVGRGKGLPHLTGAYNILEANYSPVPFFMSTNGYGIFFHNAFSTEWDMGSGRNDAYSFSAAGGELDYYFIYGPAFPSILNQYTSVTGKSPMMSLFAYGLQVGTYSGGTWGYEQFTSDKYVIELARKLRAMGIPVDIIWLDSTWRIFGEVGGKGATSFEWRETFRDPKGMFDSLYAMNYKMAGLHLRPRFDNGKTIKLLDTAQQLKYTYPEESRPGEFVNFFDSNSVNFWWNRGVMRVASQGAKFLKTDEGSAFGGLANESDKTGPQGKDIQKLHNLFPLAYAKAPYEKFEQFNGMRGLNQTREGYAGIQRYPYIFAGDWPSEWQYFAPVIKAGINIGLSGVGHWTHCMGGFEHPADPELYMRWVQFGMFSPLALVFGMDHPGYKEPWNYGEDGLKNFKKYDSLRYRLLPYIYSHAYEMYRTGMPLMRALVLDYQEDENVFEIGDQYMFGNNIMVCPVTTKGAQTRTVYLPAGNWYDYWTGKQYTGKQYVHVVTPPELLPLFIKSGSVIPMQPAMNYTNEKPVDEITLDVFPGANSLFNLYEDDGQSLRYLKNDFSTTTITLSSSSQTCRLEIEKPKGQFTPSGHTYQIRLHSPKPKEVTVNGKSLSESISSGNGWYFNQAENIIYIKSGLGNNERIAISIQF
ncbi:MAG: TIM-barrel domain-containing protein [Chitinophagaceae bacterium]